MKNMSFFIFTVSIISGSGQNAKACRYYKSLKEVKLEQSCIFFVYSNRKDTTVALWVERFAFCLLLCSANIGSCGLVILVLSNFLCCKCAMVEKANTVRLKPRRSLKNSDSRVSSLSMET